MSEQLESLLNEAAAIAMYHPSKDARAFACAVSDYFAAAPKVEREGLTDEDREILAAVVRELGEGEDGNAPGHAHAVPGIWDSDNGARAGKQCAWCLCWKKFTALAAAHGIAPAHGERKEGEK